MAPAQPKAARPGAARPMGAPDAAAEVRAAAAAGAVRLPEAAAEWAEEAVLPREVVEAPAGEPLPEVAAVVVQPAVGAEEAARPGAARDGPAVQQPGAPGVPWACRQGQLLL